MKKKVFCTLIGATFLIIGAMSFTPKMVEVMRVPDCRTEVGDWDGPLDDMCSKPGTSCESPVILE